jgi:aminopeptidase N
MRKYLHQLFLLTIIIFWITSCGAEKPDVVESGVSLALNNQRKQSIDSIDYRIGFDIPSQKNRPITGTQSISFLLKTVDKPLVLDFNVDRSKIHGVKSGTEEIEYDFVNGHIVVASRYLRNGKNELNISFEAGDLSLNRSEEYLYTLFVPDRASTCFPLFDQPNLKATFQLTLKTPAEWEAVSNGQLIDKKRESGGNIFVFGKTKRISSYLFAFTAGKFFKVTERVEGREMTMYYRETDTAKVSRNKAQIFALHGKSLKWMEDYTGIAYPFGKFDFALIPSFQYGGMEHPGAIFYSESSLFLDENASVNKRMARASVIAHESAHMWFGDLVTMDWFNDVWLKEVFANFMAAKIVHPSFPEINHDLRFLLAHYPAAYEVDRTAGTNPILQPLTNLRNAGTMYGAIIYQKAPIVMRQLERKIGEQLMQESLRDYLEKYAFGNAHWDDLVGIIDGKTSLDITNWSNVWVKTPDMPRYNISSDESRISVIQETDSVSARVWQQAVAIMWHQGDFFKDTVLDMYDGTARRIHVGNTSHLFPNTDGKAYGYFEMGRKNTSYFIENYNGNIKTFRDPVFRGSMLVNQWEQFLRGKGGEPAGFVSDMMRVLPNEENPLLVDYLLSNLQTAWWKFLPEKRRAQEQLALENLLWALLEKQPDKGIKTSYFRAFKNVALTSNGLLKMRSLWDSSLAVKDLVLSEDDRVSLACELALKGTGGKAILKKQLTQTKNPDRQKKLQFVIPALDSAEAVRDLFFESLKKVENREKEAWVLEALGYLHHPLRQRSAIKYLRPSLEILQEIQLTGDIFFPTRWMNTTFAGHSSLQAAAIASEFLSERPDYPFFLRNKILQASDMLNRSLKSRKR